MEGGIGSELYDRIGRDYSVGRHAEPTWASVIASWLTGHDVIVNVGAGTGSYEPRSNKVIPIEPSVEMLRQREPESARPIRARAEEMPLRDAVAGAAMAILSLHHWSDWTRGIAEMKRVAPNRQLILTFEPAIHNRFWLIEEYLPAMATLPSNNPPAVAEIAGRLDASAIIPMLVPSDCVDGVLPAFWARPHAYLDPRVHKFSSSFSLLSRRDVEQGISRLAADLRSGAWVRRHQAMMQQGSLDCGFRLIVA